MREDLDECGLEELVEYLDDLAGRRTPVGWTPDDAVAKTKVERRILEMVRTTVPEEARSEATQLACDVAVELRTKDDSYPARVVSIGEGGVFLATDADLPMTTHVHVLMQGGAGDERGVHVRGQIGWRGDAPRGLGVGFAEQPSEAHERRLHRFVLEVLRHRDSV